MWVHKLKNSKLLKLWSSFLVFRKGKWMEKNKTIIQTEIACKKIHWWKSFEFDKPACYKQKREIFFVTRPPTGSKFVSYFWISLKKREDKSKFVAENKVTIITITLIKKMFLKLLVKPLLYSIQPFINCFKHETVNINNFENTVSKS